MCKSRAEGGQRCAPHTRPDYLRVLAPAEEKTNLNSEEKIVLGYHAIAYATTTEGMHAIDEDISRFDTDGKYEVAAILRISRNEGLRQRAVSLEVETSIRCKNMGREIAQRSMDLSRGAGLTNWQAYKQTQSILREISEQATETTVPSGIFNKRQYAYLKTIGEQVQKEALAFALGIYNANATEEDFLAALSEFNGEDNGNSA
jgi:hypothetical protein